MTFKPGLLVQNFLLHNGCKILQDGVFALLTLK